MERVTVVLDGASLTCEQLSRLAADNTGQVSLALDQVARDRIITAREVVEDKVAAGEVVYGTTTGVNVLKNSPAPSGKAKHAQAIGNAGRWGKHVDQYEPGVCRAAWAILVNGFAKGSSVVSLYLVEQMIQWLNKAWDKESRVYSLLPVVEKQTSLSFADTVAPSVLQVETLAKYELGEEERVVERTYDFQSGEILALLSNNSFTFAEAVMCLDKFKNLLRLVEIATALDMEADKATPFIVGIEAEEVAQWPEKKAVIRRLRSLLKNSNIFVQSPSSIHPYVSLRASPDILATAWEALNKATGVVEDLINNHQSNPVLVGPWNSDNSSATIGPVAHFDTTRLFCSLSSVQQAMGCVGVSLGQRTQYRINSDGDKVASLPNRRMLVWNEASVRDCIAASLALPPATARMNSCGGYDWAAPTAQLCTMLTTLNRALARVLVVNLAVSCSVIEQRMGNNTANLLGDGCKEIFQRVQASSFTIIEESEVFSFHNLFETLGI